MYGAVPPTRAIYLVLNLSFDSTSAGCCLGTRGLSLRWVLAQLQGQACPALA